MKESVDNRRLKKETWVEGASLEFSGLRIKERHKDENKLHGF